MLQVWYNMYQDLCGFWYRWVEKNVQMCAEHVCHGESHSFFWLLLSIPLNRYEFVSWDDEIPN